MDDHDRRFDQALARYQVISAYLAMDPPRGQRRLLLEQLAGKSWTGPDGQPFQVAADTIRSWVRRYMSGGLEALENKPHPRRGCQVLTPEQIELVCRLKREVPERSLDRIILIMEDMGLVERGVVRRSTLHRVLQAEGISARQCRVPDSQDLDRFEADLPNDLWQSDMLGGPWLPDPVRPGRSRRAYLYAFVDDHSRLLLHGRFSFKGDLPALELVFRRCLQRFGQPVRVYYDNGQTYRAGHMRQIVATLGIHRIVFTRPYRPMGHGKIEKLNKFISAAFIAELKASSITTLDQLNEAFLAWADLHYNTKTHGETGQKPIDRWRAGIDKIRYADEEKLRQAFLWREKRTPDKAGVFSMFTVKYQVSAGLARHRVQVRYDPERLEQVRERVKPFEVKPHRRPKPKPDEAAPSDSPTPAADYLGHLVAKRRKQRLVEPSPQQLAEQALARRAQADQAVVDLLAEYLDPAVFHEATVREYLDRFGPFDDEQVRRVLERLMADGQRNDHHVTFYLDQIRNLRGQQSP
jgi:putative transposase